MSVFSKNVSLGFALLMFTVGEAHAQSALAGAGAGVALPDSRDEDVGPGYAFRGFAWLLSQDAVGGGLTATHVGTSSENGVATLTYLGLGGVASSGFETDSMILGWASLGAGRANGGCAADFGGEFGVRGDHRMTGTFRMGGSLSFTAVRDGCSGSTNDEALGPGEPRPATLRFALVLTLDLSFGIGGATRSH